MEDIKQALKKSIDEKQGNLWEWRGANPYHRHPLKLLNLENQPGVSAQVIRASVEKLLSRRRVQDSEADEAAMSPSRAKDLLMRPETRLICEMMRMPPVEAPSEEMEKLKHMAGETFKDPAALPWPEAVGCRSEDLAGILRRFLESGSEAHEASFESRKGFGPDLELERLSFTGISFRPRLRKGI